MLLWSLSAKCNHSVQLGHLLGWFFSLSRTARIISNVSRCFLRVDKNQFSSESLCKLSVFSGIVETITNEFCSFLVVDSIVLHSPHSSNENDELWTTDARGRWSMYESVTFLCTMAVLAQRRCGRNQASSRSSNSFTSEASVRIAAAAIRNWTDHAERETGEIWSCSFDNNGEETCHCSGNSSWLYQRNHCLR